MFNAITLTDTSCMYILSDVNNCIYRRILVQIYINNYEFYVINHFSTTDLLCCEYGIPSDFVRKSTPSLQIEISTAQLNFSNRNVLIFWKSNIQQRQ